MSRRMTMLVLGATLVACSTMALATWGQPGDAVADNVSELLDSRVRTFFDNVDEEVEFAFTNLIDGGPLEDQPESVTRLLQQARRIGTLYGNFRDAELVAERRLGDDVRILSYLYKCDEFPVLWNFTFYRTRNRTVPLGSGGTWAVVEIGFDTKLYEAVGALDRAGAGT